MSVSRLLYFHPKHGFVAVKQGFSWPAFFFGLFVGTGASCLWALRGLGNLDVALWFSTGYAGARGSVVLALVGLVGTLAYAVVRGKFGNRWVRSSLVSRLCVAARRWHLTPPIERTCQGSLRAPCPAAHVER